MSETQINLELSTIPDKQIASLITKYTFGCNFAVIKSLPFTQY